MSRLLTKLEEYSDNLTIAELKEKIKQEEALRLSKEQEEIDAIKAEFSGVYLKGLGEDMLGEHLKVIHIEEITLGSKDVDWNNYFNIKGYSLTFGEDEVRYREYTSRGYDSFSGDSLRDMEKITKEEYDKYFEIYTRINGELKDLLKREE